MSDIHKQNIQLPIFDRPEVAHDSATLEECATLNYWRNLSELLQNKNFNFQVFLNSIIAFSFL